MGYRAVGAKHLTNVADPPGSERFVVRTRHKISLGPLRVAVRSNEEHFRELHHFPESMRLAADSPVDFVVNCCNLNLDGPWPIEALAEARDKNYRGKRFAAGYYLTDHFGPAAWLMTRGTELWIFANGFEAILWPYVVKYLLTIYSAGENLLHLKAAAVAFDDAATLFIGRGGSGKTVLLARLCEAGARFVTNTHALIRGQTIVSIPTAMRVRNDPLFGAVIATGKLAPGIKSGEYIADPLTDLGWQSVKTANLRHICLVDYRGPGQHAVHEIEREVVLNYMEHFSLAVNIYGLHEDMFDYCGGDVWKFSEYWSATKSKLHGLVEQCHCHYVSCDVMEDKNLDTLRGMLAS